MLVWEGRVEPVVHHEFAVRDVECRELAWRLSCEQS